MIVQSAQVVSVEPEHIWVDCDTRRACERCARGEGCGGGLLAALLGERLHRVRVLRDGLPAELEQRVRIGLGEGVVLRAAALVYLPPLAGLFLGASAVTTLIPGDELRIAVGGLAGLVAGILLARRVAVRHAGAALMPVLLGPCEEDS